MKRRSFIKSLGAVGASAVLPSTWPRAFDMSTMYKSANAAIDYAGAQISAPEYMPQVINIFLYGGPSELSGNLTNIVDIDTNSQNSYATAFGGQILRPQGDPNGGLITPNGFWSGAGGDDMEFLLKGNGTLGDAHMSVYRTLHKVKDGTRSHRESILMSQKGSLDIENSAGVGTRIAAMLYQNRASFASAKFADESPVDLDNIVLPFVSFEGDTRSFAMDPDYAIPLLLRGTTLDEQLQDPFSRTASTDGNAGKLDPMVLKKLADPVYRSRFSGVVDADELRAYLASKIGNVQTARDAGLPTVTDADDLTALGLDPAAGPAPLVYPNPNPNVNRYSARIRAAVTLAIENPSSMYITVGGGLGGWDDHNNGIDNYPSRMNQLFDALKSAALHIKYANGTTPGGISRSTDNIVINVYGDFGRRVNLNNSEGWDHGNNQNLWTIGGSGCINAAQGGSRELGKIVGRTQRVGTPGTNNQVTEPEAGSYQAEPMSIAAAVYSYFGVTNPEILTADPDLNPEGDPALNDTGTAPGETVV